MLRVLSCATQTRATYAHTHRHAYQRLLAARLLRARAAAQTTALRVRRRRAACGSCGGGKTRPNPQTLLSGRRPSCCVAAAQKRRSQAPAACCRAPLAPSCARACALLLAAAMAAPPHTSCSGGGRSRGCGGAECRASWPALGGAHGAQLPHAPTDVASSARRGVADRLRRPLCGAGRAALRCAFGLATAALLLLPASCGKSLTSLDIMKLADIDAQARARRGGGTRARAGPSGGACGA
jgi:hypothetical protein